MPWQGSAAYVADDHSSFASQPPLEPLDLSLKFFGVVLGVLAQLTVHGVANDALNKK